MEGNKDIRWKQRFQNFEKAFILLKNSLEAKSFSVVERAGIVQIFEFTFELGWKTLKDYLEEQGVKAAFPRDVIKEAFRTQLIEDGDTWMDMLDKRNLMAHTYDDDKAELAFRLIQDKFFVAIENLYGKLNQL